MKTSRKATPSTLSRIALAVSLTLPVTAFATQGTFPHGYGVKAEGMAGVSIALPQDAVAGANNPAGMVHVGSRFDLGGAFLKVDNGAVLGGTDFNGAEDKTLYIIPQLGYNHMLDNQQSIGLSVVGNGVGTDQGGPVGPLTEPKSELQQMVSTVSYARRIDDANSLGVGLVLGYQRLRIEGPAGLGLPQGRDSSFGFGLSLGWQGQVTPELALGATWSSKVRMGKMDEFKGLLAEQGDLDIPEHYGIGAAWTRGATTVAADVMRIKWADVASLGNAGVAIAPGAPGANDGPGFGWHNQTVWRVGVAHAVSDSLTLRAGYSHGTQILDSQSTFLGILAPAANRKHWTLGATVAVAPKMELSLAYARSPKETVRGDGPGPNNGTDLYMGQHWLSASLAIHFD
ncbi:outer membrane protein transport protein [Azoarcus sp. L1K30]|uniref:OmpP1/FadL family transporter n=1 Tax=Azoarcus sp. L1K30 TaxID=2820277 RepID=UPI001B818CDF|nr:outer membrane protein transport protein [Azoarcus sp. L1K30]MBR0565332.1 outer membrane protein transport protein [Azoarcus sp. L1K30]